MKQLTLNFDRVTRVLSYGGGLNSFAMLTRAIADGIRLDLVIMANVADRDGNDPGEWPGTYRHIDEVVRPLCEANGIEFRMLETDESPIRVTRENPAGSRSLFAYMESKRMMPGRTSKLCTMAAKVDRIHAYLADRYGDAPIECWIGFETGEENRAERSAHAKARDGITKRFPLIEWGFCRCRCESYVRASGYPIPRKSACVFCPLGKKGDFQTLRDELPEHFDRVVQLEANAKLTRKGDRLSFFTHQKNGETIHGGIRSELLRPYRPVVKGCDVCGAAVAATKSVGCDYLDDNAAEAAA